MKRRKKKSKPYGIEDGVTQSLLSSWVNCREAARLYLAGWRAPGTKESLGFGGLEHDILEGLYEGIRASEIVPDLECLLQFFDTRVKAWRRKMSGWTSPMEAQTAELCVAKAAAIFEPYCAAWEADFRPSLWRELEGTFDVEWRGFRLRGRIDGVRAVGRIKTKKLWLLETKTMGRIDGALEDALSFDFQSQYYMTAAEVALGRPVEGVLYNAVRRSGFKLKDGESLPAYTARIRADAEKRPEHYFKRFELTFSKKERERFKGELYAKLVEFNGWTESDLPTYRNESACRGRWNCGWLPACSSGSMAGFVEGGRLFEELE